MDIIQSIHSAYPNLTKKQKGIAQYLMENPEDLCYITLAQLSQRTSSTELTLLRLCKKLGYDSFLDLKNAFREYTQNMVRVLSSTTYFVPEVKNENISAKTELLQQICREEARANQEFFSSVDLQEIIRSARQIRKSRRIFLCAHDISRALAIFTQARLKLLGIDAFFVDLTSIEQTQDMLEQLCKEDMVLFFSFPKYYYPLSSIAKNAVSRSATVLTITDSTASPSAAYSNYLLLCRTSTRVFYNSLSIPMALLNLLLSYVVIDMGSDYPNALPVGGDPQE